MTIHPASSSPRATLKSEAIRGPAWRDANCIDEKIPHSHQLVNSLDDSLRLWTSVGAVVVLVENEVADGAGDERIILQLEALFCKRGGVVTGGREGRRAGGQHEDL